MTENEQKLIMGIISSAGDSKAKAFKALGKVKNGEYDEARKILKEAKEADLEAHNIQTKIISDELSESENKAQISLLMVHAQDHYMTAQLARDLIEQLIDIFEEKERGGK